MNLTLPAMGEGIIEATIIKWLVREGDELQEDDPVVEVATDKVDTEIPSPVKGRLISIVAREDSVVKIGETIALIETDTDSFKGKKEKVRKEVEKIREVIESDRKEKKDIKDTGEAMRSRTPSGKFISPLVRSIVSQENISYSELDQLDGTGMDGRITKDDILRYIEDRTKEKESAVKASPEQKPEEKIPSGIIAEGDEIIEMDRVRKLIAEHMVLSKKTSPHVSSFIDADVTRLVNWRNNVKDKFLDSEGQKLTFTPLFIDATAKALYDFPMVNISVDGTKIIKKKNINIGMATALPDGNLIVPVIKNANEKSITGLAKAVNDLAGRARNNQLKPDEIRGGTFTLTNFGTYNNLSGTPIINQPQAAILGTGAIRKVPAVIETPDGDVIAIRHIMILSLSYDHRVIDGALAGKFLNRLKEILENYSPDL
ncbi:MAG TPA: dihydrolipoamide acetyltransferase family protein [Bacteroidales bacterium]|nr:dihydrolipoamide acetyltransferase family protein [Bacteroidales bacterium]